MTQLTPGQMSPYQQIDGLKQPARFHYSHAGFQRNLTIALGLTGLVCGLVWLLLGIMGSNHMMAYTIVTGLIFFAFISARTLARYIRNEVVLAVQPTGLYDGRISTQTIPWEAIKELVLTRAETEYSLSIVLWPQNAVTGNKTRHDIELTALEGGSEAILDAISQYRQIRLEQ